MKIDAKLLDLGYNDNIILKTYSFFNNKYSIYDFFEYNYGDIEYKVGLNIPNLITADMMSYRIIVEDNLEYMNCILSDEGLTDQEIKEILECIKYFFSDNQEEIEKEINKELNKKRLYNKKIDDKIKSLIETFNKR